MRDPSVDKWKADAAMIAVVHQACSEAQKNNAGEVFSPASTCE